MMNTNIIQNRLLHPILAILGFTALFGVIIHDTGIDKYTTISLGIHSETNIYSLRSDPHTHSEKSVSSHLLNAMKNNPPKTNPKSDKKHTLHLKNVRFGMIHNELYNFYFD